MLCLNVLRRIPSFFGHATVIDWRPLEQLVLSDVGSIIVKKVPRYVRPNGNYGTRSMKPKPNELVYSRISQRQISILPLV